MTEDIIDKNNLELDKSILDNDPVTKKVTELTNDEMKKIEPLVQSILNDFQKKLDNKEFTVHELIHVLGRTTIYMTQALSNDYEDFCKGYDKASELVCNNVLPALGLYAADESLKENNENGIVTYNGIYDEENFRVRNLILLAGTIIDIIYWKLKTNNVIEEMSKEEDSKEGVENNDK